MKTKLTIEVDRATQQKLHDACPELISAPERYDWAWSCPGWSSCAVKGTNFRRISFEGCLTYEMQPLADLVEHLQRVLADYRDN